MHCQGEQNKYIMFNRISTRSIPIFFLNTIDLRSAKLYNLNLCLATATHNFKWVKLRI